MLILLSLFLASPPGNVVLLSLCLASETRPPLFLFDMSLSLASFELRPAEAEFWLRMRTMAENLDADAENSLLTGQRRVGCL